MADSTQHVKALASEDGLLVESNTASSLRILSIVAMAFAAGAFGLAAIIMDDDVRVGSTISGTERTVWATVLLLIMLGFLAGVALYQRRLATRIVLVGGGKRLRITTLRLFGCGVDEVLLSDVMVSQYHGGDKAGEEAGNTPYVRLQVRNSRSYVVPLGNNVPDRERLLQVLNVSPAS